MAYCEEAKVKKHEHEWSCRWSRIIQNLPRPFDFLKVDEQGVVFALPDLFGLNNEAKNVVGYCPYQVASKGADEVVIQAVPRQEWLINRMLNEGSFFLWEISFVVLGYLSDIPDAN